MQQGLESCLAMHSLSSWVWTAAHLYQMVRTHAHFSANCLHRRITLDSPTSGLEGHSRFIFLHLLGPMVLCDHEHTLSCVSFISKIK